MLLIVNEMHPMKAKCQLPDKRIVEIARYHAFCKTPYFPNCFSLPQPHLAKMRNA